MVTVMGYPFAYQKENGEIWVDVEVLLECVSCSRKVQEVISLPVRPSNYVGCQKCRSEPTQISITIT